LTAGKMTAEGSHISEILPSLPKFSEEEMRHCSETRDFAPVPF